MTRRPFHLTTLALLLAILAVPAAPAYAQSHLVKAAPGPGATVSLPPGEVRLTFDHPLLAEGTSLHVTDTNGAPVEKGDGHIDPADPFSLVVSLPVLFEGQYTVSYTAATVGSSTILADNYNFTLDLPNPVLDLVSPNNGEAFDAGPISIRLRSRFVDFTLYDSRVRLFVDGHLYREWQGLHATVDGLQPGVHEIRSVLVQVGGEVPDTSTTVYIAVKRPDPGTAGDSSGEIDMPELPMPSPVSSTLQLAEVALAVIVLLGLGFWLGRGLD